MMADNMSRLNNSSTIASQQQQYSAQQQQSTVKHLTKSNDSNNTTVQLPSISSLLSDIYPASQPVTTAYNKQAIQDGHSKNYPNLLTTPIHAFSNTISCTAIPTTISQSNNFSSLSSSCSNYSSQQPQQQQIMMMQQPPQRHLSHSHTTQSIPPSQQQQHVLVGNRYSSLFSVYPTHQAPQQLYRENSIWETTTVTKPIYFTSTSSPNTKVDQSNSSPQPIARTQAGGIVAYNHATSRQIVTCAVPVACKTITASPTATVVPRSNTLSPIRNSQTVPNSNVLLDESGFSHSSNVSIIIGTDVKSSNSSSPSQFNDHQSSGVSSNETTTTSSSKDDLKKQPIITTTTTSVSSTCPNVEVLKKVASACIKRGNKQISAATTPTSESEDDDDDEIDLPNNYSKQKIGKLRLKSSVKGDLAAKNKNGSHKGWWTEEEHQRFLEGLEACGNNWKLIAEKYVKTRSRTQVASHGQKWKQSQGLIA